LVLVATIRAKSGAMAFRRDLIGQPPAHFAGLVRDTTVIAIPSAIIMPLGVGADAAQTIEAWRGAPPCGRRTGWACMIAIDWGTTQLRAYRLDDAGAIVSRRSRPKGIMAIPGGDFAAALDEITRDWHDAADREIVMSGMIGSALYQRALDQIGLGAELIESDAATTRGLHAVAELRRKARP
jgi:hypothetical protein